MANKMQFYAQMAEDAARQITGSRDQWTAFLRTAARLYKYPYHEQLMIFAQMKLFLLSANNGIDACPSWDMQLASSTGSGTIPAA